VRVQLFAALNERLGRRELDVPDDEVASVAALDAWLRARHPELAGATYRIAVNRRYAGPDDAVAPGDEVALIPPVSGGRR